ncbi:MAG: hypothetical protein KAT70_09550 [Thermoplasmata archaeon]|nr:hypothetical protein [Thermoplasmata archaeon]
MLPEKVRKAEEARDWACFVSFLEESESKLSTEEHSKERSIDKADIKEEQK